MYLRVERMISRLGWVCLVGVLTATSCSKEKVISSICVDEATASNSIGSLVALQTALPKGASIESREDAMVVKYEGREYSVSRRKGDSQTCFDFTPPIPLRR